MNMDNNPSSRRHFQLLCEILQQQLDELKTEDKPALLDTDQVKETLREIYDAVHRLGLETYSRESPNHIQVSANADIPANEMRTPELSQENGENHRPPFIDETAIHAAVQNAQEPLQESKPVEVAPEIVPGLQAARKNAFEEPSSSPLKAEMESTIGSRYTAAETLYDRIGKTPQETRLSEKFKSKPLEDLRISIGLNERFSFINALFGGDQQSFYQAIDKLNSASSYETAQSELDQLMATYGWTYNNTSVIEFAELVKRRYGI